MKIHAIKICRKWYDRVHLGYKTHELRKNDRDYQVGDVLSYQDYPVQYQSVITHVLTSDTCEGLKEGYCILSIKKYEHENNT